MAGEIILPYPIAFFLNMVHTVPMTNTETTALTYSDVAAAWMAWRTYSADPTSTYTGRMAAYGAAVRMEVAWRATLKGLGC